MSCVAVERRTGKCSDAEVSLHVVVVEMQTLQRRRSVCCLAYRISTFSDFASRLCLTNCGS